MKGRSLDFFPNLLFLHLSEQHHSLSSGSSQIFSYFPHNIVSIPETIPIDFTSWPNIYFSFIDYTKAFDCVDHNKLWKILKEMGIPDHLICLLQNLYAGQEAIVRTGHGTADWFKIGNRVCQGCLLSPCLFNLHAEYIMQNAGLDEA